MKKILMVHEVASQAEILGTALNKYYGDRFELKRMIYFDHKYYKKSDGILKVGLDINQVQKNIYHKAKAGFKILTFLFVNLKLIRESDVIHFFSGSSFLPNNKDLFLLKFFFNIKIIMEYNGSEVRMPNHSMKVNPYYKLSEGCHYFSDQKVEKNLKNIGKYLDKVIVPYYELLGNIEGIFPFSKIEILPHVIESNEILEGNKLKNNAQSNKVKILHAPSNKNTKGSVLIKKCIKLLKKKYSYIDYIEMTNMGREDVINTIKGSDIIIDQMLIGDYGIFAIESMSYGKPTVCYLLDSVISQYPKDLGIVNSDLMQLYKTIEELVLDEKKRIKVGEKSLQYIKSYHLDKGVVKKYKKILESF